MAFEKERNPLGANATYVSNNLSNFKKGFSKKIISPIVMGIIFFIVVTPTGLILRLFQKDVLNLKFNNNNIFFKNIIITYVT